MVPKVRNRVINSPPFVPIQNHIKRIQVLPTDFWRSIWILFFLLCLGLPGCLFSSGFPTITVYGLSLSTMCATWAAYLIFLYLITRIVFDGECQSWNSLVCSMLPPSATSSLLGPNIFHRTLHSHTLTDTQTLSHTLSPCSCLRF